MPVIDETSYNAPYLFARSHLGTIIPNLLRFPGLISYDRQRIFTPDGDFLDLDWSVEGSDKLLILCHGLESSSKATYVVGMVKYFNKRGYDTLSFNFRSCSGEMNLTVPFYHPGQTDDLQQVIDEGIKRGYKEIYLAGFSLGGALILRYLGERPNSLPEEIKRAAVFSAPSDLGATARHLGEGSGLVYGKGFLFKYRRKMALKEKTRPGTYKMELWNEIKSMQDFDEAFCAEWYGHKDRFGFYDAISSKHLLPQIAVPTLIVNAMNDPFLPPECYPFEEAKSAENVFLEVPEMGGHVGFMTFSWKGIYWSETRTADFLEGKELA